MHTLLGILSGIALLVWGTHIMDTLRLGFNVFLNGDLKSAQMLLAQKAEFRELERAYAGTHLDRLAWQTPESIETSSLHLDIINDFKRINSHFCAIAYPILEEAGVLARTPLRDEVANGSKRTNGPQPHLRRS
jgi:phosphate:Na+ symporter